MSLFRTAVTASMRCSLHKPNLSSRWLRLPLPPSSIAIRSFANTTDDDDKTDFSKLLKNANPDRIQGIEVNPESVGNKILPGNLVYKKYKWSGNTRKVPMELEHGYFWMIGDLKRTENKPTLSNDTVIPEGDAQHFPVLKGLKSLSGNVVDLPFCLMDNDDDGSKQPKCTLVAFSFRDYGYKFLDSWTQPFAKAFGGQSSRAEVVRVSITERWSMRPLKGILTTIIRRNTPVDKHENTLLYFGTDVDEFRDVLRMHNLMTGYVFLVDDLGRVRFAGSGPATDEDVAKVIQLAKDLTPRNTNSTRSRKVAKRGAGSPKKRTR